MTARKKDRAPATEPPTPVPDYEIVDPNRVKIHDLGPRDFEYMRSVINIIRLCGKEAVIETADNEPIVTIYAVPRAP
jgi:hypothetical protein